MHLIFSSLSSMRTRTKSLKSFTFDLLIEFLGPFAALIVYISVLEQQAKYGDALEIISGKLGSLLAIEVDRLRVQVLSEAFPCSWFCIMLLQKLLKKN